VCNIENGVGRKSCPSTFVWTDCEADSCNEGYQLQKGACEPVDKSADSLLIEGEEWSNTAVVIGVSVGVVALIAAGAGIAAVVIYRKRRANVSSAQPMADLGLSRGQSSQHLLAPPTPVAASSASLAPRFPPPAHSPSFVVPRPPPVAPQFRVGMQCQAKYSGDGRFYRAVIDDVRMDDYLVRYVDFGNESEWVSASSLKF
jgi:hypothetical protein